MQLLVAFLIGWVQGGQAAMIEYLREESRCARMASVPVGT
jgi:hypothetical protein